MNFKLTFFNGHYFTFSFSFFLALWINTAVTNNTAVANTGSSTMNKSRPLGHVLLAPLSAPKKRFAAFACTVNPEELLLKRTHTFKSAAHNLSHNITSNLI